MLISRRLYKQIVANPILEYYPVIKTNYNLFIEATKMNFKIMLSQRS